MYLKNSVFFVAVAFCLCSCGGVQERFQQSTPLGPGPLAELEQNLANTEISGMTLVTQGRTNAPLNDGTQNTSVDFSYSLFGNPVPIMPLGPVFEPADPNSPRPAQNQPNSQATLVTRHFHLAQGFFSPGAQTRFAVANRNERNDLRLDTLRGPGGWRVERVMLVWSERDWFSQLWRQNGRQVAERWLAKRYTFTNTSRSSRFVYEYREPYPACMPQQVDMRGIRAGLLTPTASRCLDNFIAHADSFVGLNAGNEASELGFMMIPAEPVLQAKGAEGAAPRRVLLDAVPILGDVERIERDDLLRF